MIEPVLKDDDLLTDIRAADRPDDGLRLWWLGQSGFLIQHAGEHLLFDPYLSDSLTRKYAGSERPHLRMTARPIAPERLDFVDVVTASHHHTDHLDGDTLRPLIAASPRVRIVVPEAHGGLAAARCEVAPERLDPIDAGRSISIGNFRIHAVWSAHELPETDRDGRHLFLGFVVRCGPWSIYHAGDTVDCPGLAEQLDGFGIDIALLPINGAAPARQVSGNFWGDEAAAFARRIDARLAIPCHYEMFTFNSTTPDEFVRACLKLDQPFAVLKAGQRFDAVSIRPRGDRPN